MPGRQYFTGEDAACLRQQPRFDVGLWGEYRPPTGGGALKLRFCSCHISSLHLAQVEKHTSPFERAAKRPRVRPRLGVGVHGRTRGEEQEAFSAPRLASLDSRTANAVKGMGSAGRTGSESLSSASMAGPVSSAAPQWRPSHNTRHETGALWHGLAGQVHSGSRLSAAAVPSRRTSPRRRQCGCSAASSTATIRTSTPGCPRSGSHCASTRCTS